MTNHKQGDSYTKWMVVVLVVLCIAIGYVLWRIASHLP